MKTALYGFNSSVVVWLGMAMLSVSSYILPSAAAAGEAAASASPARDGDIAIEEEFRSALASRNAAALTLFIARHPGHRLATEAREKLRSEHQK